jgi:hypothetical protein
VNSIPENAEQDHTKEEREPGDSGPGQGNSWLNRTVIGTGVTSFFSDLSHEAVTVLLIMLMMISASGYPKAKGKEG